MSLEALQIAASLLTAAIIGATAIAALIQLRHIRASNELSAFSEAFELWYSAPIQDGFRFIQHELKQRMDDPQFRQELDTAGVVDHAKHPELNVCDFFDNIGVMVSLGLLREDIILHPGGQLVDNLWTQLSPTIAIMRASAGVNCMSLLSMWRIEPGYGTSAIQTVFKCAVGSDFQTPTSGYEPTQTDINTS